MSRLTVRDNKTGVYPDVEEIVLKEDWAKNMIYRESDTFALTENGNLILLDECGHYAVCPRDRFSVSVKRVSTGVCDKNGVEISEGDKVKFDGEIYSLRYTEGEYRLIDTNRMLDYRLGECYPFIEII